MVARLIRASSARIRSTSSSAAMWPSCRRKTWTMKSRLLERRPPAGRRCSTNSDADCIREPGASGAEGRTAAAGRLGVRILDGEPAAHVVVDEVHFGPAEVPQTDRIDQQPHAVHFEHLVGLGVAIALIDHQAVLKPRAAATLDEHAEPGAEAALLHQQFRNLRRCRWRDIDHALIIRGSLWKTGLCPLLRKPSSAWLPIGWRHACGLATHRCSQRPRTQPCARP